MTELDAIDRAIRAIEVRRERAAMEAEIQRRLRVAFDQALAAERRRLALVR